MLPPWPGWDGLHPLIIHFPIGLLMVSPIFVLLALAVRRHERAFSWTTLVLLALGTAATFIAVSTGKAAGELAEHNDAINAVLSRHEELAETTRTVFAVLTALYAAFVLLPARVPRLARSVYRRAGNGVFLVLLLSACVLVVNTAHQGGRLVHQLGVHAIMPAAGTATPIARPDEH